MDRIKNISAAIAIGMFTLYFGSQVISSIICYRTKFPLKHKSKEITLQVEELKNIPIPNTIISSDAEVIAEKIIAPQYGIIKWWGNSDKIYKTNEVMGCVQYTDTLNYDLVVKNYNNLYSNYEFLLKHYGADNDDVTNVRAIQEALRSLLDAEKLYRIAESSTLKAHYDCYLGLYPGFGIGSSVKHGDEIGYIIPVDKKQSIMASFSIGHNIQIGNQGYFVCETLDKQKKHIPVIVTDVAQAYARGKCQVTAEIEDQANPFSDNFIAPGVKGSLIIMTEILDKDEHLIIPEAAVISYAVNGNLIHLVNIVWIDHDDRMHFTLLHDFNAQYLNTYPCKILPIQPTGRKIIKCSEFLKFTANKRKKAYALITSPPDLTNIEPGMIKLEESKNQDLELMNFAISGEETEGDDN